MGLLEAFYKEPFLLVFVFVVFFIVQRTVRHIFGKSRIPPGPIGLPFVGYLPFLGKEPYKDYIKLSKKYGHIFQLQLGWQRLVVLNSAESIEKAFKIGVFAGRQNDSYLTHTVRKAGEDAIFFSDGLKWRFNRKAGIRALSTFNSSRNARLEVSIHEALEWLFKKLEENDNVPITTKDILVSCTGGIMSSLCFGTPANPDNPFFTELVAALNVTMKEMEPLMILEYFPFLEVFYKERSKKVFYALKGILDKVWEQTNEKLEKVNTDIVTDILTGVEKAIQETPEAEKIGFGMKDNEMRRMIFDIFDGGFFTTAENLEWGLLLLAQRPDIQKHLAEEVRRVCGRGAFPTLDGDYPKLHYTKAVFYEILRFGSNTALALPHRALKNVEFEDFIIRQDTTLIANVYAVHFDPVRFPDPDHFNPDRFLNADEEFSQSESDKVMSFSVGKRRCIGEGMAIQFIPLILASIVQRFSVTLDPRTDGDPSTEATMLFTRSPGAHKLAFTKRP